MKMNPEPKAMLVAALRSGEFQQAHRQLCNRKGYCCLGVASELFRRTTGQGKWVDEGLDVNVFVVGDAWSDVALVSLVMDWLGADGNAARIPKETFDRFKEENPHFRGFDLAQLNDHGWTFEQIADAIEKYW